MNKPEAGKPTSHNMQRPLLIGATSTAMVYFLPSINQTDKIISTFAAGGAGFGVGLFLNRNQHLPSEKIAETPELPSTHIEQVLQDKHKVLGQDEDVRRIRG